MIRTPSASWLSCITLLSRSSSIFATADLTGPKLGDFDVVLALQAEHVADADGFLLVIDQQILLGLDHALMDAEIAELADEGPVATLKTCEMARIGSGSGR